MQMESTNTMQKKLWSNVIGYGKSTNLNVNAKNNRTTIPVTERESKGQ